MKKFVSIALSILVFSSLTIQSFAAVSDVNANNKTYDDLIKSSKSSVEVSTSKLSSDNEADKAYENVVNEENYIVSLISRLSKKETNTANWEYNLKFLQDNYSDIQNKSKSSKINMGYIDSYIEAYKMVLLMKNSPTEKSKTQTDTVSISSTFDRDAAVNYANEYYSDYNTEYPDWTSYGGDCANFVSQCLYAGGKPMEGNPGSSSSAQNFANWFSSGNTCDTSNVSATWRGADAFRNYWQDHALGYQNFTTYSTDAYNYGYSGYAVSLLNSNGRAYHTLMIVGYDSTNKDLICAAHTSDTNTGSLKTKSSNASGFIIYATW